VAIHFIEVLPLEKQTAWLIASEFWTDSHHFIPENPRYVAISHYDVQVFFATLKRAFFFRGKY
jgi:hypothetical protein